jgi:hypothetical protein
MIYVLNDVRYFSNYGLYITGVTTDPVFNDGWISNKPNLSIKGNTLYIDYSHVYDLSDSTYIKRTFAAFGNTGVTFYFIPSEYYDGLKEYRNTIGGTCYLAETLNDDKILICTIASGFTTDSNYLNYSKENFIDIPQYQFETTNSLTGYFLVNSMPNLSIENFKSIGVIGNRYGFEEYITIDGGTQENDGRIQLDSFVTLKDNREILYFSSGGTAQDFSDSLTNVSLSLRGDTDSLTAPRFSNLTGIFVVRRKTNNFIINCYENQSQNQSILRKQELASTNTDFYTTFEECDSCPDLIYGTSGTTTFDEIGESFSNLIFLRILSNNLASVTSATAGTIIQTSTATITVARRSENVIKIDLSHPSLLNYELSLYTDPAKTLPLTATQFTVYGRVGYNNSYAVVRNYVTDTNLYGMLEGINTINFIINV